MILLRIILALMVSLLASLAQSTNQFELREGDRVVLLGDTFIEREQTYGHIEYFFTTHWPDRNVTFRNLGWSADTPEGISRAGFDPEEKGWFHLTNQLTAVKPNVVFLGYGTASSFAGQAGLAKFTAGINRIIDTVQELAGKEPVRFLVLSPIAHETLPAPLPDPAEHNRQLALYTKSLKEIAERRGAHFVSLFDRLNQYQFQQPAPPLTDNGIHLTDYGYRRAAEVIGMALGLEPHIWRLGITRDGRIREGSYGNHLLEHSKTNDYAKFIAVDYQLVDPLMPGNPTNYPFATPDNRVQIVGLQPGTYDVKIDGQTYERITDRDFQRFGIGITYGPQFDQAEELRQAIIKKNELFFQDRKSVV